MSMVRLLVLGVLELKGPSHGYALQRELQAWNIEAWTKVKPGSIYHALKQLTKENKLSELGTESSTEGPGRTLYQLTDSGQTEFRQLLEQSFLSTEQAELAVAVALMQCLPRNRVLELLQTQVQQLQAYQTGLNQLQPGFTDPSAAPHTPDLLALWSSHLQVSQNWTEQLITRIQTGEYCFVDEKPKTST